MSVTTKKKHVERELYEDFSLPEDHQSIVKVVKPCGNNLHQVTTPEGELFLVSMPHKFRKHLWIKRGNYVVTEPIPEGNKVRAEIVRILMKDHIRHIQSNNMWPAAFSELGQEDKRCDTPPQDNTRVHKGSVSDSDSGSDSEDDLLMGNPNRPQSFYESDSDSESDSEEGESDSEDSEEGESVSGEDSGGEGDGSRDDSCK